MPRLDAERIAHFRRLCMVVNHLQRIVDKALVDELDLPLAWFDVLTEVRSAGGSMRVHELCNVLDDVPSSLSRRLDRMEDRDLVQRTATPRPDDRRAVTVSLTREGRAVWRDASILYRRLVQQQFAQTLSDSDLAALTRVWSKLETPGFT